MGFNTKAFGVYYKRIPTGSFLSASGAFAGLFVGNVLTSSWWTTNYNGSYNVSTSFVNWPNDTSTAAPFYITSRDSSSNAGYMVIPWGSMAADFLWNIKTPEWSLSTASAAWTFFDDVFNVTRTGGHFTSSVWSVSLTNTGSFWRQYGSSSYQALGVASYNITSSWYIWDARFANLQGTTSELRYATKVVSTDSRGIPLGTYNITSSYVHGVSGRPAGNTPGAGTDYTYKVGYTPTWPNTGSTYSTSPIDNQYFDRGGGAAISRALVSSSLVTASLYYTSTSNPNLNTYRIALKQRRLFYPTPVSGSHSGFGALTATDWWHRLMTGYFAYEMFNENGGIYNVQFTLKRHISSDHYPDSGSFMNVFIHDVQTVAPLPVSRTPGMAGWYPPANNIVTVGHAYNGGPAMSFYDTQTGYLYEKFNINLVQYGYPAQLCFEPSGSLADGSYFGCIVDDVSFCKIGVTTDPRFIKPSNFVSGQYTPIYSGESTPPPAS